MSDSFTTTLAVDRTPHDVYEAVKDVRQWWMAEINGGTEEVGDEFSYTVPGMHHCAMRVTALEPGKRVAWKVIDSDMTFVEDGAEWVNTEMQFDITETGSGTQLVFTHEGLIPDFECYDACHGAWTHYVGTSLRNYLTTGTGDPSSNPGEQVGS